MTSTFLLYAVVILYFGVTIYLANQQQLTQEHGTAVRMLHYIGVFMIFLLGLFSLMVALADVQVDQLAEQDEMLQPLNVGLGAVIASMLLSGLGAAAAYIAIASTEARQLLAQVIRQRGDYNPQSPVHTTAIVLTLLMTVSQIVLFLLSGGPEAMAESIEAEGVDPGLPVLQAVLQIAAAFLGVGYAIRRDLAQTLARLGLRMPTPEDIRWGFGGGLILYGIAIVFSVLISILLPETVDQTSAAESLAAAFATVPLALLLSASAAVGEEIFYRGALQPVFGNVLVSMFFAVMHTQLLLSPAIVVIFIVSYFLGWLRQKHSTTAAIIAHFVYNMVQLLLLIAASSVGVEG